jgi:hypothetical protein
MAQLAPRPSQPARPIPHGLVSLLDMMNFALYDFAIAQLLIRQEWAIAAAKAARVPDSMISKEDKERLESNLTHGIAPPLNALFISEERLGIIFTKARQGATYAEFEHELKALDTDVYGSIKYERFYHYPRDKGALVLRVPADWAATLTAFPSALEDIKAAVDCYALGHPNASIFHSMMVLERGLPLLAKKLKVPIRKDRATWAPIIDNIRSEIDRRRRLLGSPPRGSAPLSASAARAEKALLEPCQEAAIEFRYFADVWRNHVAHGRGDYREEDAKRVLEHVRTFMEIIATKLKLKEKP